jgi:spore coat protein U-like protein
MKTNKFFMAIAMTLFIISGSVTVWAQSSEVTENVPVTATVYAQLLLSAESDLDFGSVANVDGLAKSVSVDGEAGYGSDGNVTAGLVKIVRAEDAEITFRLDAPPTALVGPEAAELPIGNWLTAFSYSEEGAKTDTAAAAEDTVVAGEGTDVFVFIGATVTPGATTTVGAYTGTVTVSAEYN